MYVCMHAFIWHHREADAMVHVGSSEDNVGGVSSLLLTIWSLGIKLRPWCLADLFYIFVKECVYAYALLSLCVYVHIYKYGYALTTVKVQKSLLSTLISMLIYCFVHQARLSVNFWGFSCLSLLSPHKSTGITDVQFGVGSMWALGTGTQILMLVWQMLYPLSQFHKSISLYNVWIAYANIEREREKEVFFFILTAIENSATINIGVQICLQDGAFIHLGVYAQESYC